MNSLKSAAACTVRSNAIAPHIQILKIATRGIAGTTRKSTSIESTPKPQQSTPFIPREFLSTPHQTTHRSRTSTNTTTTNTNDFQTLISALTTSLTATRHPNLPHLTSLLRAYTSDPTHWSRYAHANASKQYTRNLVHSVPGLFNMLLLVWTPGKKSPVHDHADAHCLMKILKGAVVERRFGVPGCGEYGKGEMRETAKKVYERGKVAYMCDEMGLHEISNPSPVEYAVSLHLYSPPNAATRGCHVYDLETGEAKHVMQCAWDSVDGVPT